MWWGCVCLLFTHSEDALLQFHEWSVVYTIWTTVCFNVYHYVYEHTYVCGVVPYMNAVLLNLSLTHTCSNKLEGESFMGSPNSAMADVRMVVHIPLKANGSGTGGSSGSGGTNKPPGPALVQWTEVQHHPGLVCAVFQVHWTDTVFTLTHLLCAYSYALTYIRSCVYNLCIDDYIMHTRTHKNCM